MPESVSVPEVRARPPLPLITPEKVLEALVSVSVLLPRTTLPAPESVWTEAPLVVPAMLKLPASATPEEKAIDPVPLSASVVPEPMVVAPV